MILDSTAYKFPISSSNTLNIRLKGSSCLPRFERNQEEGVDVFAEQRFSNCSAYTRDHRRWRTAYISFPRNFPLLTPSPGEIWYLSGWNNREGGEGGSLHKVLCNSRSIDSIIVHETIISGTRHRLYNGRSGATNTSIDNHPVTCSVGNRVTLIALIDARATADVDRPLVIIIQD